MGFGDITPVQPIARMLAVTTAVFGQLYLAVVMGILIGRFSSVLRKNLVAPSKANPGNPITLGRNKLSKR